VNIAFTSSESKKQPNIQYSVPDIDTQYHVACPDKVNYKTLFTKRWFNN